MSGLLAAALLTLSGVLLVLNGEGTWKAVGGCLLILVAMALVVKMAPAGEA